MTKESKQLNIFLGAIVAIGILSPFMVSNASRQIEAVQIDVDNMEVTQEVYRTIYNVSLSCDLAEPLRVALTDDKITFSEAIAMGDLCKAQALEHADQPFERGMLKQELDYLQNGGVSM